MELINPRTLLVVANLLGLLCALVLWVQARSFPADIQGLADWAKAVALMGCAAGLASLRGLLPDAATIVLASALLLFGELLLVFGLVRYLGRQARWRPALDAVVGLVLLVAWLTWGSPSYPGRIFIMSLAHIAFFSLGAALAWQARPHGFGSRFLVVAFVLGALIAAWRLATLSTDAAGGDDLFDRDLVQQVYLGAFSLGILGLSFGFILLANERLREELEFLATRDPMTGTLNRRAFFARAAVEWARSVRSGAPLAVIASDIDFFKKVNDTHGHQVGDRVIKAYAQRTGTTLRLPDILARFGGEEFVVLLPDTGLAAACRVAERIRQAAATRDGTTLPPFTVSLGVAATDAGEDFADVDALIAHADAALYRAKQGGRNRVER